MSANQSRRATLLLLGCTLLAPATIRAQDPRAAMVQNAARVWLGLVDKLDATSTWNLAGAKFGEPGDLDKL